MTSATRRPTLFVTGFPYDTRAKELAQEFEKFGEIIRCDVPAPAAGKSARYAFIEFIHEDDASKAQSRLNGETFVGSRLIVEWAKRTPGSRWRPNGPPPPRSERDYRDRDRDRDRDYDRDRDRRRGDSDRDRRDRDRSRSPRRDSYRDHRDRDRQSDRGGDRRRSRSPRSEKRKDESPKKERDVDMEDRERRRSATPPPPSGSVSREPTGRDHGRGERDRRSGREYENGHSREDRY